MKELERERGFPPEREEAEGWFLGLFFVGWRGEAPFDEVWCGIG
jgi:hypothetical protein